MAKKAENEVEVAYVCVGKRKMANGTIATYFVKADVVGDAAWPEGSGLAFPKGYYACGGHYTITLTGDSLYTKGPKGPQYHGPYADAKKIAEWKAFEIAAKTWHATQKAEKEFRLKGFDDVLAPIKKAMRCTNHAGRAAILVEVIRELSD